MARMAGVPKTPDEIEDEQKTLEDERNQNLQRNAGVQPKTDTPTSAPAPSSKQTTSTSAQTTPKT